MSIRVIATLSAGLGLAGMAMAEVPQVATDIAPVHSLVARVMEGAGAPSLVVQPGATPHAYSMRPSEAAALEGAQIVVWMGEALTPWLDGAIASLASDAHVITLLDAPDTRRLAFRKGATFDAHDHGDEHAHDDHAADSHDDAADSDHTGHGHAHDHDHDAAEESGHADHDHAHDGVDPHAWLDPANARAWLGLIATELGEHDPGNAALYAANAAAAQQELTTLESRIAAQLGPFGEVPFLVFHDAYQYFETRFGIRAAGAISLSDASDPSAARIAELRDLAQARAIACVFAEPQFDPRLVNTVFGGVARHGVVDPLATEVTPGPGLYPALLSDMADAFSDCLAEE